MLAVLFQRLARFSPTLVGTFPLGLQVEGSDLDIACACDAGGLDELEAVIRQVEPPPTQVTRVAMQSEAVVATFAADPPIEVFGQAMPVHAQAGFRHMVVEARLLQVGGDALRARIRAAKRSGLKTEPAFAQLLGLDGDPYAAMLALDEWPADRLAALVARALAPGPAPTIHRHTGERRALWPLFRLADDSDRAIGQYLGAGEVLVASAGDVLVGHVQLIDAGEPGTRELKSLAVVEQYRATGVGRRLVEAAIAHARADGARRLVLSTGAADVALLRFYQRRGFRFTGVDRDVFVPAAGYASDLTVDGIPLLDRVWLDRAL